MKTYTTAQRATEAWLRKAKKDGRATVSGGGGGWWSVKGMGKIQGFNALALRLVAGRQLVQWGTGWALQTKEDALAQQSTMALSDLRRDLVAACDQVRRGK